MKSKVYHQLILVNAKLFLRNFNNYTKKIIVSKIDTYNEGFISNKVEYKLYTEEGSKIDLLPCEGVESLLVSSPYHDNTTIRFDIGKELFQKGYDIFEPNDKLYNDICANYSIDNKDTTLSERRKHLYQNVSFCDEGCKYVNINYNKNIINCECNITKFIINSNKGDNKAIDKDFIEERAPHNIKVIKCYKQLSLSALESNIGFYSGLSLTVTTLTLCLINFTKSFSSLFGNISLYVSSPMIIDKSELFNDDEKKIHHKKSIYASSCNSKENLMSLQREKSDTSISIQKKRTNFS